MIPYNFKSGTKQSVQRVFRDATFTTVTDR